MSDSATKFIASTLLAINLLPGLGAQSVVAAGTIRTQGTHTSRFSGPGRSQDVRDDGTAQEQQPVTGQPNPAPGTPTIADVDAEIQKSLARIKVNEAIIAEAQNDFARMAKLSEDGYSKDLKKSGSRLTKYLNRNTPERPAAVYVDPNKFDTALALGMTPELATERILGLQRIKVSHEQVGYIAGSMKASDPSKFAAKDAFTQYPSAHYDIWDKNPQACVIVPESGYAALMPVMGLSYQDNLEYTNLHEGWHCKNTRFDLGNIPKEAFANANLYAPENSINNADQMKLFSLLNKGESLSDVGAVGDMIRSGHGLDVLDKLRQDRLSSPEDYTHWTAQSLEGLRDKINEMGIGKFRSLNDADARKLYEDVVDKNTFSPGVAEVIFTYRKLSDDEDRRSIRDWKSNFSIIESLMAAGAAVHDGADMKTFDAAIANAPNDRAKAALAGLRDQVNEIGVERFRNLSDADAEKIGKALKDSGVTASDIGENAVDYARMPADDRRTVDRLLADLKTDLPVALEMMKPYGEPPTDAEKAAQAEAAKNAPATPLSPGERQVFQQLSQWDAAQMLQDRAFAREGKITPGTLIRAYGKMQDELRGELRKNPEDPLLRAKVTKLQQSFITSVRTTDYVAVNAARNVNIFDKEPGLKTAMELKPAPAPETTSPPKGAKPDDPPAEDAKPPVPQARRAPGLGA